MKKILFLLLCTVSMYSQTLQNPTFGNTTTNTLKIKTNTTSTTALDVGVLETDGSLNKMTPTNLPIPQVPLNYSVLTPNIGGHLSGIDLKLGALSGTTAGISTRVWFTADQTTITAGTFDLTNATSKGTAPIHQQTVANDDGQKKYFTTDLIGQPFAMVTTFPSGTYAGSLSASTTPTNANQKFTVELYRCNNAGTPIASGVSGAVTGSLGVTVIMIMDSGEVTLANASITNVPVSTNLGTGGFTINAGERIRYHVSAEKVGTAGGVINESVYYGSSYNSFIDVPVIYNSTSIKDVSTVTNGTGTVTDALNTINAKIPTTYSKIVYVNATNPNSATIFDINNPPITNNNALKSDVNNFYIGTDASGWVYNVSTVNYVTKTVTSATSNFFLEGTPTDAGNSKTAPIQRTGSLIINNTNAPIALVGNSVDNIGVSASSDNGIALSVSTTTGSKIASFIVNGTEKAKILPTGGYVVPGFTASSSLLAGGTTLANPNSGIGTIGNLPIFTASTEFGNSSVRQIANGNIIITGGAGADALALIKSTGASLSLSGSTGTTNPVIFGATNSTNPDYELYVGGSKRIGVTSAGVANIGNLAGTGVRQVVADASGNLSATDAAPTSGTYTPTLTNTLNVSGATLSNATYTRVGNIVTVNVSFTVTATLASTLSQVKVSLPVTRTPATTIRVGNLTTVEAVTSSFNSGVVDVSSTTEATLYFKSISAANYTISASFQYSVI